MQCKLTDYQYLAIYIRHRAIHYPIIVIKNSQIHHLLCQPINVSIGVGILYPHQNQQSTPYFRFQHTLNRY